MMKPRFGQCGQARGSAPFSTALAALASCVGTAGVSRSDYHRETQWRARERSERDRASASLAVAITQLGLA